MLKFLGIFIVLATCDLIFGETSCIGKCPSHASSDSPIAFLPHEDCNMYCVCDFGKPIEMPCPGNLHFSTELNVCVDPAIAECTGNKPEFLIEAIQNSQEQDKKERESIFVTSYETSYTCIGKCPSKDNPAVAIKLAHEDCSKYCLCKKGTPVERSCDKDLLFNPNEAVCVPQKEVKCTGYNPYEPTPPPPIDEAVEQGCVAKCPLGYAALIPHQDCSKFCHCIIKAVIVKNCPKNTHFSSEEGQCVAPEDAKCTGENGYKPPTCIGTCPVNPNSNHIVLLAHEDCAKYCRCQNAKPIIRKCDDGLHFSPSFGMCTDPEKAECTGIGGINGEKEVDDTEFENFFLLKKMFD